MSSVAAARSTRPAGDSVATDDLHVLAHVIRSPDGEQALRTAAELAGARGRLSAVAVAVVEERGQRCCAPSGAAWTRLMREQAQEECAGMARALGDEVSATYGVFTGASPEEALVFAASELAGDVLVVPAARGPLARLARRRISRKARCAVVEAPRAVRR